MALFKTQNLIFTYPQSTVNSLDGVSVSIDSGDFVLLMGKSGSGKSTLLKLFKSEVSPVGKISGTLDINCTSTAFVNQNIDMAFVSEKVYSELAFALENKRLSNDEISLKIGEIASYFNITDILDKDINSLSGGEKSLVALASAMIEGAQAVVLDEPFANLDPKACAQLFAMLKRLNEELGVSVIVSSHFSENLITACNKLIILDKGKVIYNSSPSDVVKRDDLVYFLPPCARLFDERPMTVRDAKKCELKYSQKKYEPQRDCRKTVVLKNITFAYGKNQKDILSELNFTAYGGKFNVIIGANASGKTTLLKVIAGIKKPYGGKIKTSGSVAYLPQNPQYLFTKELVSDEISTNTAVKLGISDCLNRHPYDLSFGQMQKVALGILLEQNADIILLDEPTKAFDYFSREELAKIIKQLCNAGKTIIAVSHDMNFVGDYCDFVSFLSGGEIVTTGDRRSVLSSLDFYTSQIRAITKGHLDLTVGRGDLV